MSRRAPLVDVAAIKREVEQAEQREREQLAERYLRGVEISVLGALITRYDFELFADVETDDFAIPQHRAVFGAIRALEADGKEVDGEFLLSDIAAVLDAADQRSDTCVRESVTDDFLAELVTPPAYVVPARDRTSIAYAIADLKAASIARSSSAGAIAIIDVVTRLRRRS